MPLPVDPQILDAVHAVYTTDLGLPEDWTAEQRARFVASEADKITWMVRAAASTLGDHFIEGHRHRSGESDLDHNVRAELMAAARAEAYDRILSTELYELIADDTSDL
jgi:hypothetical protein